MAHMSRRVIAVVSAVIALAGSSGPVLAQTTTVARPSTTIPVVKIQANSFFFCKYSASSCSSSNSNFKTRIKTGTKVKWFYKDTECDGIALCPGHNVKIGSHKASATVKKDGALIFSMVFKSVGTFSYVCTHHANTGMTGKIVVVKR
jgi:copper binding plastocyanin/azurin family protein